MKRYLVHFTLDELNECIKALNDRKDTAKDMLVRVQNGTPYYPADERRYVEEIDTINGALESINEYEMEALK